MDIETDSVLLREAAWGCWLLFQKPRRVLQARTPAEVKPILQALDVALTEPGGWAAGFLAYEAAPGLDSALITHKESDFPLAWFGLYRAPEVLTRPPDMPAGLDISDPLPWTPEIGREAYDDAIRRIKDHIARGDTYQVNYTYRLRTPFTGDPLTLFLQLTSAQKAPYAALAHLGRFMILSASPELFFRLEGERLCSRPMKGTARRGRTLAEDLEQRAWLANSAKDRAENVMIVDMVRNDIGKVARTGSVQAPELFSVEKYPTVWQMVSTVCGDVQASLSEIFEALFPAASITGAPKPRTMQIIASLETTPRRIYTGCIGYAGPGRRAQFNVAIRTVLVDLHTQQAEYGVGGGITWDSAEAAEFDESLAKARILYTRLPRFSLLESIRWTPAEGYFLLEFHLERLAETAQYFDFPLEIEAARRALANTAATLGRQALEQGERFQAQAKDGTQLSGAYKVRLLVDEEGRITTQAEPIALDEPGKVLEVCLAPRPVDMTDPFLFHKTTHREEYERARQECEQATGRQWDEVILWNEQGELTEALNSNIIVELQGVRYTPPVRCGLLAGTYRRWLLEKGLLVEKSLTREVLQGEHRLYLINSVRGERQARFV